LHSFKISFAKVATMMQSLSVPELFDLQACRTSLCLVPHCVYPDLEKFDELHDESFLRPSSILYPEGV